MVVTVVDVDDEKRVGNSLLEICSKLLCWGFKLKKNVPWKGALLIYAWSTQNICALFRSGGILGTHARISKVHYGTQSSWYIPCLSKYNHFLMDLVWIIIMQMRTEACVLKNGHRDLILSRYFGWTLKLLLFLEKLGERMADFFTALRLPIIFYAMFNLSQLSSSMILVARSVKYCSQFFFYNFPYCQNPF